MTLIILITEIGRLAKAAGGLRDIAGLAIAQLNLGTLVVVFL